MLSPKRRNLGRGEHHESAAGATGPGAPGAKRPGDHHGAGRRCGPAHRADGQDELCGGARPASPPALEATAGQLGLDGGEEKSIRNEAVLKSFQRERGCFHVGQCRVAHKTTAHRAAERAFSISSAKEHSINQGSGLLPGLKAIAA